MKSIRIRAWSYVLGRMFSPEEMTIDQMALLPDGRFANIHSDPKLTRIYEHSEMTPLLSTGMVDDDGAEIFAGDLLNMPYMNQPAEVRFIAGKWVYQIKKGEFYGTAWDLYPHVMEGGNQINGKVIGNVYENPELMEVANA